MTPLTVNDCNSKKHGLCYTRVYRIFQGIKGRCYCKTHYAYIHYGGRGISVCDEWRNNFKAFYDWAMANGYADNLTIDRINNDGNYEPSNCRWVSMKVQCENRRSNRILTYKGVSLNLMQWVEKLGVNYGALLARLKRGWSVEKAIGTPFSASDTRKKPVLQYDKNGNFIKQWNSAKDAVDELGGSRTCISDCCKGKLKTAGGFIWKYKLTEERK